MDVVVVGGRCAGASLARLLALQGVQVVVVDRASFPSDTRSSHALASGGVLLLAQWGLLDPVLAAGTPVARSIGMKVGDLEATIPLPDGHPGSMAPRRTVLDAILVDAARAAGTEVRERTTFRGLTTDGHGRVTGIRATTERGTQVTIEAALVVGADGLDSAVAAAVGAERYDVSPSVVSGVYAYYADVDVRHNQLALGRDHCTLMFPTNDDLVCVAAVVRDNSFNTLIAGGDDAVLDVIRSASARVGEAVSSGRRVSRRFAFRGRDNQRRIPWGPGWALVGDAGYHRDPITGQGIADAFVSAQLLADAVLDGLGGGSTLEDALARYQARRDDLTAELYDVTCELSRFAWTDDALLPLVLRYRAGVEATAMAVASGLKGDVATTAGHPGHLTSVSGGSSAGDAPRLVGKVGRAS